NRQSVALADNAGLQRDDRGSGGRAGVGCASVVVVIGARAGASACCFLLRFRSGRRDAGCKIDAYSVDDGTRKWRLFDHFATDACLLQFDLHGNVEPAQQQNGDGAGEQHFEQGEAGPRRARWNTPHQLPPPPIAPEPLLDEVLEPPITPLYFGSMTYWLMLV